TRIEVVAQVDGEEDPLELLQELEAEADPRFTELILPEKVVVKTVEVRVYNLNNDEPAHVHLWELQFHPMR
ncbi:MAG TPA: hypothetical protein VK856_05315, partial [Anaerolineaceae bacterium]|nr:hypothetical protein [Anaerolineaceae bacterium]